MARRWGNGAMLGVGALLGALVIGFLILIANCAMTGKTCPPYGVKELTEDLVGMLLGFMAGRYSK